MHNFIAKLRSLLDDKTYQYYITWSKQEDSFIVLNSEQFSTQVLPLTFKHSNYNSFVRQLNLYGFTKVNRNYHRQNSLSDEERAKIPKEFRHQFFIKADPTLATKIKRKNPKRICTSHNNSDLNSDGSASSELHSAAFNDFEHLTFKFPNDDDFGSPTKTDLHSAVVEEHEQSTFKYRNDFEDETPTKTDLYFSTNNSDHSEQSSTTESTPSLNYVSVFLKSSKENLDRTNDDIEEISPRSLKVQSLLAPIRKKWF
ncbi:hypothetical protein HDU92_005363 [Lobulomyces angularis]|nr:hypothetical protein HDU92_005363 [Lobulomyces angularis]